MNIFKPAGRRTAAMRSGRRISFIYAIPLVAALMFSMAAFASPGHDHGEGAVASVGTGLPRFSAVSELFELVGVLNGKQLTLYLDHAATNAPVKDATLDFEWSGTRLKTEPHGEGEFIAMLAELPKPDVIAISLTVTAGQDTDLLAGEFDLRPAAAAGTAVHRDMKPWLVGAGAAIVLALFAAWVIKGRRKRNMGEVS